MSASARARQRIPVPEIPLRFLCDGVESTGHLKDVSRAGISVCSAEIPRSGAVVAIQFRAPSGALVDVRGEVRWTTQGLAGARGPAGFGVVLTEPPREYRDFFLWALAQAKEDPGSLA